MYLGRFQQGAEVSLVLQCTDASDTPDEPSDCPVAQVYLDGATPSLIETLSMPADLRGVETGLFRRPLFLGSAFEAGRYLIVSKWNDSDGVAHVAMSAFHILPGGSSDGAVIAMAQMNRPESSFLVFQCDSGRILRKANPR